MAKSKTSSTPLRQIYFGQKSIQIEKNLKKWLGDPAKLEENLKVWFAENARVMDENNSLKDKLSDKNLEIQNLKNGFDGERIKWVNERTKLQNQVDTANASRDTFLQKLEKSYEFTKKTYVYLGNYGSNPILQDLGQLKWLLRKHNKPTTDKDYYTLYDLVKMSPTVVENLKKDVASWKSVYELERDKVKDRDQKITEKDNRIVQLDQTLKGSALIFQKQINIIDNLTQQLQTEYSKNTGNQIFQSYLKDGIKRLNNEKTDLTQALKDLEDAKTQSETLRDTEIANLRNEITNKDKTTQSLELKNEKLLTSYKKLINHLADARQLVSHLQTDLQTEKQDKEHIQKELNDALAILNKPTTTIGTQTDLTAEQITQMEQDIETKKSELEQLREEQRQERTDKIQEITDLQTKLDMETKTKEQLIKYLSIYENSHVIAWSLSDKETSEEVLKRKPWKGQESNLFIEGGHYQKKDIEIDLSGYGVQNIFCYLINSFEKKYKIIFNNPNAKQSFNLKPFPFTCFWLENGVGFANSQYSKDKQWEIINGGKH